MNRIRRVHLSDYGRSHGLLPAHSHPHQHLYHHPISLNLIAGYTGILSIAHAAFYGVGAYVAALLAVNYRTPFLIVEQKVRQVLAIADRAYILKLGQVSDRGRAQEFLDGERLRKSFL